MSKENIIIGLDLGASQIRTVVAQVQEDDSSPLILGVGVAPSSGISNGVVVDIEDAIDAINKSKEDRFESEIDIENCYIDGIDL